MTMKRLMISAALLVATACGDDSSSDDSTDDSTTTKDAGKDASSSIPKADGGKDASATKDAGGGGDDCDALTYDSFGKDFMDTYCASCHAKSVTGGQRQGAPPEDVFDTLAQIQADKDEVQMQVKTKVMPFKLPNVAQPTQAERDKFDAWMTCGPN
jgi:uncharacterized membrane protein